MIDKLHLSVVWTTPDHSYDGLASSLGEALELIEKAEADASPSSTMVEFFERETGLALAIGVGVESAAAVVTFQQSLDPPYFISIGDRNAAGVVDFCYGNEPTEYLARNAITRADAIEALKWFVENRTRPPGLSWEQL